MLVAGAIAATCAAMVMNTPADAARAPVGATYTMTGTSAFSIRCTIARIDRSRPPGRVELDDERLGALGLGAVDRDARPGAR